MPGLVQLPLEIAGLVASVVASGHAIIYKRDPRSATLWALLIWFLPIVGPVLYLFLGINRVRRSALALRADKIRHRTTPQVTPDVFAQDATFSKPEMENLRLLERLVDRVASRPLLAGNRVEALIDGLQAYPAMIKAIDSATLTIGLSSYIFDTAGIGETFIEALTRAKQRGVEVRVLVDAIGARYSWPNVQHILLQRGIPAALFDQRLGSRWIPAFNLRNHRKILVVDGKVGFTGGMNIKREYASGDVEMFHDLHFRVSGPAVAHLTEVFSDDWQFTTNESLLGGKWFPPLEPLGQEFVRGIEAGPDESFDRVRWVIIGALNAARHSVQIVTPYFLPDPAIISAIVSASLRGVEINIVIPQNSNLPYVQWAVFGQIWQVLEHGCRVWLHPGPFDHSKLMLVDGAWILFGSANWDTRSLRLNFEFNMECYSPKLAQHINLFVQDRLSLCQPLTLAEINARTLPIQLRDGLARLFAPYL
jgi:cardiolipin synthase